MGSFHNTRFFNEPFSTRFLGCIFSEIKVETLECIMCKNMLINASSLHTRNRLTCVQSKFKIAIHIIFQTHCESETNTHMIPDSLN